MNRKAHIMMAQNAKTDILKVVSEAFSSQIKAPSQQIRIDLSSVKFLRLFEWTVLIAVLERMAQSVKRTLTDINIDFVGSTPELLLTPDEYWNQKDMVPATRAFQFSDHVYSMVGFAESLNSLDVLNSPNKPFVTFGYPWISRKGRTLKAYYKSHSGHTVLHPLTRVDSKEDCATFLDPSRINDWKKTMRERFSASPIFSTEEIWRVLFYELAANIWEHAGCTGFISARVIEDPFRPPRHWLPWVVRTYGSLYIGIPPSMRTGLVELSIADAGNGFLTTLKKFYCKAKEIPETDSVRLTDVLSFAFDELGSCKAEHESWIVERHALNRILITIHKYGGMLRLRSGNSEVIFRPVAGDFLKSTKIGYRPQLAHQYSYSLPGAQVQILLPLFPIVSERLRHRSILATSLPKTYRVEVGQPKGHLIPVHDRLSFANAAALRHEQPEFIKACRDLAEEILLHKPRPHREPLVFDMSNLTWSAPQFETFLHLMQNIIQTRPCLLIELHPPLARETREFECIAAPTSLTGLVVPKAKSITGKSVEQLSERLYLETYSGIGSTVLGIDTRGDKYIFGLKKYRYEHALLRLTEEHLTVEDILNFVGVQQGDEAAIRSILTPANFLFRPIGNKWQMAWDEEMLHIEANRIVTRHFDAVIDRSYAWLRKRYARQIRNNSNDAGTEAQMTDKSAPVFYLPWIGKWRSDFLQCSCIFSRQRQMDEIAQRLVYRLSSILEKLHASLNDINELAATTTPSLLLAFAIHNWWPTSSPPKVVDLGYYALHQEHMPILSKQLNVVFVQDVLDTEDVTESVLRRLTAEGRHVSCVIAAVRLIENLPSTRVTNIHEISMISNGGSLPGTTPAHAMFELRRPEKAEPPSETESDSSAFWIEPRTLRAIRYPTLRREFELGRDLYLDRRDSFLADLEKLREQPLLVAGHHVYANRHYAVTVNIKGLLDSPIGDQLAEWIADICEGRSRRSKAAFWESPEGSKLKGDVSLVLMPLHSQIHYLWPKVERILASRGRRQPHWLLEATLLSGSSSYFFPDQFLRQLLQVIADRSRARDDLSPNVISSALRILVLDDSIVTARTSGSILYDLLRHVSKAYRWANKHIQETSAPIQWIRYFSVLNQMDEPHSFLLHNLKSIGQHEIPVIFEEWAPSIGIPLFEQKTCVFCQDRYRMLGFIHRWMDDPSQIAATDWAKKAEIDLRPKAIDAIELSTPVTLPNKIDLLAPRKKFRSRQSATLFSYADTAIWKFYELMNLSYPPGDILRSAKLAFAPPNSDNDVITQYERYRWAVIHWCFHNWPRVQADAAQAIFEDVALNEIRLNTGLLAKIIEASSALSTEPIIVNLIRESITLLSNLEYRRNFGEPLAPERIAHATRLDTALRLFMFSPTLDEELSLNPDVSSTRRSLIEHLDAEATKLDSHGHSFVRNLYRNLLRPTHQADPRWALMVVAESLFRGRDPIHPAGDHLLLPRLLRDALESGGGNDEERQLLHGSLAQFIAALDDLEQHIMMSHLPSVKAIRDYAIAVLKWAHAPVTNDNPLHTPEELSELSIGLGLDGDFIGDVNRLLHQDINYYMQMLTRFANDMGAGKLELLFPIPDDVANARVLAPSQYLLHLLRNKAIDAVLSVSNKQCRSELQASLIQGHNRQWRVLFTILTDFASLEETQRLTRESNSGQIEQQVLSNFGGDFPKMWERPDAEAINRGFTSAFKFSVLSGFRPRRKER